jgi:RNA polymerase sigma factor for flagellar operon FliA
MDELAALWQKFKKENDRTTRETLILNYVNLVKYVVGRLAVGLPPSLQYQDLIGYGTLGLIEAIDRFDPDYGVKFETFAISRIRGYVIDSLRTLDLMPRSVYRQARQIEQAIAMLTQTLNRTPTDEEVADHLEISLEQYHKWLVNVNFVIISMDQVITFDNGTEVTMHDSLEDTTMPNPAQYTDDSESKEQLVSALQLLPHREQMMISLYYNDGLTMKEIGQVLNVSESRVSQIHAKAMLSLRGVLRANNAAPNQVYNRRGKNVPVYAVAS